MKNFPRLIICDIDGTISDCRHRQHLAAQKDWNGFHALMHLDESNRNVVRFVKDAISYEDTRLIFLTGRPIEHFMTTSDWLASACDLWLHDDYISLIMRPERDHSPDYELKLKLLDNELSEGESGIWLRSLGIDPMLQEEKAKFLLFLEDRDRVCASFRDAGYNCWQVAEGAF